MINTLSKMPQKIPTIVWVFFIPKIYAATQPVQAPVTGSGIPTKNINPSNFNLSTIFPFLADLSNSHEKNLSKTEYLLRYLDAGLNNKIIGMVTMKLAIMDTITTLYQGSLRTKIPYGIEPLDSITGIIEIKTIIRYGLLVYWDSMFTMSSNNYFFYY